MKLTVVGVRTVTLKHPSTRWYHALVEGGWHGACHFARRSAFTIILASFPMSIETPTIAGAMVAMVPAGKFKSGGPCQ